MGGPIFIAGDGRSGTTLLSVILDSHPELSVGPELHFRVPENLGKHILDVLSIRLKSSDEEWETYRHNPRWRYAFLFVQRVQRFGISPDRLIKLIHSLISEGYYLENFEERCRLVEVIALEKAKRKRVRRWGIKIMRELPLFKKYLNVWPNATFIHIVRDGRDVAASQMLDHASWGYRSIDAAADGWCKMLKVAREMPENSILEIRYEDLVLDTENVTHRITDFLQIDWSKDVLMHWKSKSEFLLSPMGHPSSQQVAKPLLPDSIGRYRKQLSKEQISKFELQAHQYLEEMGYL